MSNKKYIPQLFLFSSELSQPFPKVKVGKGEIPAIPSFGSRSILPSEERLLPDPSEGAGLACGPFASFTKPRGGKGEFSSRTHVEGGDEGKGERCPIEGGGWENFDWPKGKIMVKEKFYRQRGQEFFDSTRRSDHGHSGREMG